MIHSLAIKNFGLFKEVSIDFSEGINVITGESGAGKSMLIKALISLISGNIPKNLRNKNGSISAYITVNDEIKKELKEFLDISKENEIVLSVNFNEKRSVFRANGMIIPKSILEKIGSYIMEVHTQDSQVLLRNPKYHNHLVYKIFKENLEELIIQYEENYKKYIELKEKLNKVPSDPSELYRKIDILNFQIEEIERIDPKENEDEILKNEYKKLSNIEEIKSKLEKSMAILKDNEENIDVFIGEIIEDLSDISSYGYSEDLNIAISIQDMINELYSTLESKLYDLELDPERLEEVSQRLNDIMNLKRKYGPTLEDVFLNLEKFRNELNELNDLEKILSEINPLIEKERAVLFKIGDEIKKKGEKVLKNIEEKIKKELYALNMQYAEIKFEFNKLDEPKKFGVYNIRLLAKTTPQSAFMPLEKIASGGELSRIILAIEKILGEIHLVETMLFDEIDSGVGQRIADVIGKKLKEFSEIKQLIVITHMPQVAHYADKHFKIFKLEDNSGVYSQIAELNSNDRLKEIKEMYGEIVFDKEGGIK
ncbi:DNA repair protein RecN (Recombination protein N) [Marinitoga hydrogenitolerans DSM 16785]|uniref:DNA repair protein RecN n=1 Tax=Marinitoga hydrogenitolerans (strain DSM 16785 / JCM 12826 / AT1271) TaxID=1122195 RepID=A0A1M4TWN0_MARH1|nr:AAA family ATPase [Marinitoga hydrogenitolerans]SHE48764.1 DNA repair protein RecN (Recombination protein N) [Marinitoga hydrogenitolerans DSM 16785]